MREIKFRGLDVKTKKFVYGDLVTGGSYSRTGTSQSGKFIREQEITHEDIDTFLSDGKVRFHMNLVQVIEGTESQYYGHKDENGVDIYEGDIVTHGNSKALQIMWHQDYCKIMVGMPNQGSGHLTKHKAAKLQIIGNIYENPELLEQTK